MRGIRLDTCTHEKYNWSNQWWGLLDVLDKETAEHDVQQQWSQQSPLTQFKRAFELTANVSWSSWGPNEYHVTSRKRRPIRLSQRRRRSQLHLTKRVRKQEIESKLLDASPLKQPVSLTKVVCLLQDLREALPRDLRGVAMDYLTSEAEPTGANAISDEPPMKKQRPWDDVAAKQEHTQNAANTNIMEDE